MAMDLEPPMHRIVNFFLFTYLLTHSLTPWCRILFEKSDCHSACQKISMVSGSLVTTAWRDLRLRMEGGPPDTNLSCEYTE
jgi:hypothetical protein